MSLYLYSHNYSDDANDVTQDVLIQLYKSNKKFESDVHIKNSAISAVHYASGCAIECRKIAVTNTTYENCFVYVFPNTTLTGYSSGLVTRNLEELYIDNFNPQKLILSTGDSNNTNSGIITGDCSSEFFKYRP